MKIREGLTFDDVLLVPQPSSLASRKDAVTSTMLGGIVLNNPLISANIDTVTGPEMALAMQQNGGMGILHRYASEDAIVGWCEWLVKYGWHAITSVGLKESEEYIKRLRYLTPIVCLDIAHGGMTQAVDQVKRLKDFGFLDIIAGNVATARTALPLVEAGANVVKVGVGCGAVCSTRSVSGHGVPQLTAIMDVDQLRNDMSLTFQIIADGGLKTSGDIVKALAAGADSVMSGFLFAGTNETPNPDEYRGMASFEARTAHKGSFDGTPEGVSGSPTLKGPVAGVIKDLVGGIQSGLSYSGAENIRDLQVKAEWVKVTHAGTVENSTRI